MGVVQGEAKDILELFESDGEEIYELFREAKSRRLASEGAKQAKSSWRYRITVAAVTAIVSFTLLTALRFLPVH